jgi:hypothetical protein
MNSLSPSLPKGKGWCLDQGLKRVYFNKDENSKNFLQGFFKVLFFGEDLGDAFRKIKAATADSVESLRYE